MLSYRVYLRPALGYMIHKNEATQGVDNIEEIIAKDFLWSSPACPPMCTCTHMNIYAYREYIHPERGEERGRDRETQSQERDGPGSLEDLETKNKAWPPVSVRHRPGFAKENPSQNNVLRGDEAMGGGTQPEEVRH